MYFPDVIFLEKPKSVREASEHRGQQDQPEHERSEPKDRIGELARKRPRTQFSKVGEHHGNKNGGRRSGARR